MKRIKIKHLPSLVDQKWNDELRLQMIAKLASHREGILPFAQYAYEYSVDDDAEIRSSDIRPVGIVFEPGYALDLVRVHIRPDVPKEKVIAILTTLIAAVRRHDGEDWMEELTEAVDQFVGLYELDHPTDQISFAEIGGAGAPPEESGADK